MDARSRPAPRSLAEDPARFPTGIGPGYWARSRAGSKNGASGCGKAMPTIKNSCALVRERTMRPTSAGTRASNPASWKCVWLHQSIWDARQVPEPCSIICRAIQSCKPQGVACPGPAEQSGSCFGKPVVFCPNHRGTSNPLSFGSRWRRSRWMRKNVSSVSPEQSAASASVNM
jgi:hypothetical protein